MPGSIRSSTTRSGRLRGDRVERARPVGGQRHLELGPLQVAAHDVADGRVVVDDEYALPHESSVRPDRRTRRRRNVRQHTVSGAGAGGTGDRPRRRLAGERPPVSRLTRRRCRWRTPRAPGRSRAADAGRGRRAPRGPPAAAAPRRPASVRSAMLASRAIAASMQSCSATRPSTARASRGASCTHVGVEARRRPRWRPGARRTPPAAARRTVPPPRSGRAPLTLGRARASDRLARAGLRIGRRPPGGAGSVGARGITDMAHLRTRPRRPVGSS